MAAAACTTSVQAALECSCSECIGVVPTSMICGLCTSPIRLQFDDMTSWHTPFELERVVVMWFQG